jgi:hypothetical protein
MTNDRTLPEVRDQFLTLHREVGTLATDALHLHPTWRQVFSRKKLRELEERLDKHFTTFMSLDADLTAHARPPNDVNSAMFYLVHFQLHFGVRDAVRGVLTDTGSVLTGLRNQLDFRSSLALSVLAILISVIGVVMGAGG